MAAVTLSKDNFEEVTAKGTVFIDFWAALCPPCQRFAPIYDQTAEANPDILFAKVDVEAQPELAAGFDIHSIPTLVVNRGPYGCPPGPERSPATCSRSG